MKHISYNDKKINMEELKLLFYLYRPTNCTYACHTIVLKHTKNIWITGIKYEHLKLPYIYLQCHYFTLSLYGYSTLYFPIHIYNLTKCNSISSHIFCPWKSCREIIVFFMLIKAMGLFTFWCLSGLKNNKMVIIKHGPGKNLKIGHRSLCWK